MTVNNISFSENMEFREPIKHEILFFFKGGRKLLENIEQSGFKALKHKTFLSERPVLKGNLFIVKIVSKLFQSEIFPIYVNLSL